MAETKGMNDSTKEPMEEHEHNEKYVNNVGVCIASNEHSHDSLHHTSHNVDNECSVTIVSTDSLASETGKRVFTNDKWWCCSRCFESKSYIHLSLMPLINHHVTTGKLTSYQRKWLKHSFVDYLRNLDSRALSHRNRFRSVHTSLITFGVLLTSLVLLSKTRYVDEYENVGIIMFWVTAVVSIANNFVTAFMVDMKITEETVLYYKNASLMKAMGNMFLTCTQKYEIFPTPDAAFRTFVKDIEEVKLSIASEKISLISHTNKSGKYGPEYYYKEWDKFIDTS